MRNNMDLKHEFETETGEGIGYLEGKTDPQDNGTYNDTYVLWLEERLVNLLSTHNVSNCRCKEPVKSSNG